MKINYNSVVVFVKDVARAKKFYNQTLDLDVKIDMGNNVILESGIALWKPEPDHIINAQKGSPTKQNKSFELYFETENLDEVFERLEKVSVKFLHKLRQESWGQRTIRFFDPDDNIIEVGESLSTFLRRMAAKGMTTPEIADVTGMQKSDIENVLAK